MSGSALPGRPDRAGPAAVGQRGDATGTITAIAEHPIWLENRHTWTDAADITPGDQLRTPTGTTAKVTETHTRTAPQHVFNLTITDIHTYYVLAGETPVLVHNSGPCVGLSSAIGQDSFLTKAAQQAGKNEKVQRDLDHMLGQLSRGNMNPGISSKALVGTDVGGVQIVGKADKGNEAKVIARLKQLYG